jgi:hypothetical protein
MVVRVIEDYVLRDVPRRHIPQDRTVHSHRCENLRSRDEAVVSVVVMRDTLAHRQRHCSLRIIYDTVSKVLDIRAQVKLNYCYTSRWLSFPAPLMFSRNVRFEWLAFQSWIWEVTGSILSARNSVLHTDFLLFSSLLTGKFWNRTL